MAPHWGGGEAGVSMSKGRRRIYGEYRQYAEFRAGARRFLARKEASPREEYFNRLAALFFIAFAFEAFLNHIGEEVCSDWRDRVERSPTRRKALFLCERLGIAVQPESRPFVTLFRCVSRRNALAHAKYDAFDFETNSSEQDVMFPPRERHRYADRDFVEMAYEDLSAFIPLVSNAAGREDEGLEILGMSFGDPVE